MGCQKAIQLNILSKSEAWALFKDNAGLDDGFSTLNDVAKEVVGECKGLPLAVVTIAKALKCESLDGWRPANQRLKDSRYLDNEEVFGEVYRPLKLSYNYLKKQNSQTTENDIQSCFLLCPFFSEDYEIPIEMLIMFGIGVGLFSNICFIEGKRMEIGVALRKLQKSGLLLEFDKSEKFIAACKKPPVYCIITEYMSQGTLRMYLNKKVPYSLSTETILRLALNISRGMEYLFSQGVIHRDLKSNNLLLNDEMRVKVADFGTSCLETQCQETKGNMGTYRWMAPEMIKEKPNTRKVDVYSFGIVLWELTTALLPFQGKTPVQAAFAVAEKNERPPLPESCQPALAHLIKRCWVANPTKRPDFSDIVSALERYDECVKEGLPLTSHSRLVNRNVILERLRGCVSMSSSIPVHA